MVKETKTPDPKGKASATEAKPQKKKKEKILYNVVFFHKWCKACGICSAFCTKQIIETDDTGLPYIKKMDSCIGCRFCEIHCPDFAITIKERHLERRHSNGKR